MRSMPLDRTFFRQNPVDLARDLLGRHLVRYINGQRLTVRIVETEAYLGVPDLAAHTAGGRRTARNQSMYLDGGHLYVYFTYGMHYCMNIVASTAEDPVAVLLRAGEPLEGIEVMQASRSRATRLTDLCSGPAKLCQALQIDRKYDGIDLLAPESAIVVEPGDLSRSFVKESIVTRPRIGVGYAKEWADKPLRFYLRDNPHVSRP